MVDLWVLLPWNSDIVTVDPQSALATPNSKMIGTVIEHKSSTRFCFVTTEQTSTNCTNWKEQ